MTQLLPFLGHQKEYDQINFNQGLTDGDNLQVGGERDSGVLESARRPAAVEGLSASMESR